MLNGPKIQNLDHSCMQRSILRLLQNGEFCGSKKKCLNGNVHLDVTYTVYDTHNNCIALK